MVLLCLESTHSLEKSSSTQFEKFSSNSVENKTFRNFRNFFKGCNVVLLCLESSQSNANNFPQNVSNSIKKKSYFWIAFDECFRMIYILLDFLEVRNFHWFR